MLPSLALHPRPDLCFHFQRLGEELPPRLKMLNKFSSNFHAWQISLRTAWIIAPRLSNRLNALLQDTDATHPVLRLAIINNKIVSMQSISI